MQHRLTTILQHNCQIVLSEPLIVGVSGGPDSLCLMHLLMRLGYPVVVAHYNHLLRPEGGEEALRVRAFSEKMHTPFILGSGDVAAYAQEQSLSLEEAAREARYQFLFKEAKRLGAQAVAVGHTADDQVETMLMHLLRGAGMDGLQGMAFRTLPNPWSAEIPLIRPLLSSWREEVMAYLEENHLQASLDASNLDKTFFRNRLRHEIIPNLEGYQPKLRRLLWRTADILREESRALDGLVETAWEKFSTERGRGYLMFDGRSMSSEPVAVQRRLLRRAIAHLRPGLRNVDYEAVERGRAFLIQQQRHGQCSLVGGLILLHEGKRDWLASWEADLPRASWPQVASTSPVKLKISGETLLQEGWTLRANAPVEAVTIRDQFVNNADPFQAWVDAEALHGALSVRGRRFGDRLRPLGMSGHSMKISDLMVNAKIPRRARAAWPLVCAGDEIIWVPGCRQGDSFRVTQETRHVVYLRLSQYRSENG